MGDGRAAAGSSAQSSAASSHAPRTGHSDPPGRPGRCPTPAGDPPLTGPPPAPAGGQARRGGGGASLLQGGQWLSQSPADCRFENRVLSISPGAAGWSWASRGLGSPQGRTPHLPAAHSFPVERGGSGRSDSSSAHRQLGRQAPGACVRPAGSSVAPAIPAPRFRPPGCRATGLPSRSPPLAIQSQLALDRYRCKQVANTCRSTASAAAATFPFQRHGGVLVATASDLFIRCFHNQRLQASWPLLPPAAKQRRSAEAGSQPPSAAHSGAPPLHAHHPAHDDFGEGGADREAQACRQTRSAGLQPLRCWRSPRAEIADLPAGPGPWPGPGSGSSGEACPPPIRPGPTAAPRTPAAATSHACGW